MHILRQKVLCLQKRWNNIALFHRKIIIDTYPLAELNQCVLDPAYRLVANVVDVL